jgi:hypothetical protein
VPTIAKLLGKAQREPANVRFVDLLKICKEFFGEPRQSSGSHVIFKMPWQGDPRVNIQDDNGKAKAYQVRQVLAAIDKIRSYRES